MQFRALARRKPTPLAWMPSIPAHWTALALSRVTVLRCDGPFGSAIKSEDYVDSGVRVIRLQNIGSAEFRNGDAAFLDADYVKSEIGDGHWVEPDDVLIAGLGDENNPLGRACLAPSALGPAIVKADCYRFRLDRAKADPSFVALQLASTAIAECGSMATGSTRQRLNLGLAGTRVVALPPTLSEQRLIVERVQRETGRIDGLIGKKTRFIELLREKRRALMTHATTKGLSALAPVKDSGVDWLGQVPMHWDVSPIKYLVAFRSGGTPSKDDRTFWDGDVPWASAKDLKVETLDDTEDHITAIALEAGAASLVPAGSVLVVVRGMILARIFPVTVAAVPMAINQDLKALLASERLDAEFLACLLRGTASVSLARLEEAAHGTKALRMESWTDLRLPVPPLPEQLEIVSSLRSRFSVLDGLVDQTARSIELLRERRAALISAAVTGQIDLRTEQLTETLEPA